MKRRELKEMIKAAFIAEITDADEFFYSPVREEDLDEMLARLSEEEIEEGDDKVVNPYLAEAERMDSETKEIFDSLETLRSQAKEDDDEKFETLLNNALTMVRQHMHGDRKLDLKALKNTIEKGDFDAFAKFQRSVTEAKDEEEETSVTMDAEEETDGGEEKSSDSIVIDKKIVSLSSLPDETRKILDTLETLRAQAEEFGDQKFITQVGNTITFFTRDFVVAGDEPTRAKVDESLEILKMKKLAGLLTEGEYAKALLKEEEELEDWEEVKNEYFQRANKEYGWDFDDDETIDALEYSDESWQRRFARKLINIGDMYYEDWKDEANDAWESTQPN
jgi:hypothetical protein